jgi:crotonobetainyl-CoA:carnitine CoA-transferase CaiB-like acyl-CoA transferase
MTSIHSTLKRLLEAIHSSTNLEEHHVTFCDSDPILPTPFRIGEAGAASMAAIGLLIAELWKLKTGKVQSISISARAAAIAQRSHQYLKINGQSPELWDPISGFYQTKDKRWIQYHCNFPHHKEGVLRLLSVEEDRSKVTEATQRYTALELEHALQETGMCGVMIRSRQEWLEHPQHQTTQHLPLIEIEQFCTSTSKPIPKEERVLSDIKVLDLTRVLAGPVCGKILAEHGADVLLLNSPRLPNILPLVIDTSFGKKSAFLDLDSVEGAEKLRSLVSKCDIFLQSYRPFSLKDKGFGMDELAKINDHLIYVSIDAFTDRGPWGKHRGFDSMVQSVTGIALEQGGHTKPVHLPAQALDYLTGYLATIGILEALRRRHTQGGAYHVKVSLLKTASSCTIWGQFLIART